VTGSGRRVSRRTIVIVAFLAVAILQLVVPAAVMLAGPNTDADGAEYRYRYGWQMFTQAELDVRYTVTPRNGPARDIDPVGEIGSFWGNVHFGPAAPERLCRRISDAAVITRSVKPEAGEASMVDTYRCR